jgi:hypothetical protein
MYRIILAGLITILSLSRRTAAIRRDKNNTNAVRKYKFAHMLHPWGKKQYA